MLTVSEAQASLLGAARAARVINRVSQEDALKLGVSETEALGIFRVDDGKANMAPPAAKAVYRRMVGVKLPNGEYVGVAEQFSMPDLIRRGKRQGRDEGAA